MLRDSVNYKPKRGGWCRRKTYLLQFIEKKQQIEGKDEKIYRSGSAQEELYGLCQIRKQRNSRRMESQEFAVVCKDP
jgi:hypothetical protein